MNLNQVTLPAIDIAASVAFYRLMGFKQVVNAPQYARFECSTGDATFSVHTSEFSADSGVVVYFETEHLDEKVKSLQALGLVFTQEPKDEPWLWREARLKDPAGNTICLYSADENRKNPPWRLKT
jgi:predicted enzyme related to lactoylglutathione lyase